MYSHSRLGAERALTEIQADDEDSYIAMGTVGGVSELGSATQCLQVVTQHLPSN